MVFLGFSYGISPAVMYNLVPLSIEKKFLGKKKKKDFFEFFFEIFIFKNRNWKWADGMDCWFFSFNFSIHFWLFVR